MRPLSIFISSTCYDLKSLREHLRSQIHSWGHDPILSEYPSFPVVPDLSTIESCKKVVRERADVLVLIVGGKRGALDPATMRSVVNSEYREACVAGLDCFVFVDQQVWDLLPFFRKNPGADFSTIVDSTDVFRFLEEIVKETKWIFPFRRTEEILTTLQFQLSIRFQDVLSRLKNNRLVISPEFVSEPELIAQIALGKGPLWEYRLTCELMRDRLARLDAKFHELDSGFVVRRTRFLAGRDTINHIQNLLQDVVNVVQASVKVLHEQLTPAFGPPGVPGDEIQIKRACDNLYQLFLALYEWELDVRYVRPHAAFEALFSKMRGWTKELIDEFRRIPVELGDLLDDPELSGQHNIELVIKAPSGLAEFNAEFERIKNDQSIIAAIS